ncbi:hypothetical protein BKA56DRAFT_634776 [Ilyonectria sp. MPI-CAGE-AT-0026]|nr:hypothetical protein BKA56DRAFT_634776 [Ilyonectria sp. MPI-CAGE-AT-0026]
MSLIVVVGASGAQGGSVVNQLLKNPNWRIRGITRNASGEKAQQLAKTGIEVTTADLDDEASLVHAFEGATAVFAVTTFWEAIDTVGRDGAGDAEVQQCINLAKAASVIPTLQHYIVSALPPASKISKGKFKVPHLDSKQKGVDWMVENVPELWAKTTEFWPGAYTSNLAFFPMLKFVPVQDSGNYAFITPSSPSAYLPLAGDLETNCGIVVEGILNAGSKAYGKIAVCVTDYVAMKDIASEFEKVTGKSAAYLEISDEDMYKIWGAFGAELASQLRWSEEYPDWHSFFPHRVISFADLGIEGKLVHFREALVGLKDRLTGSPSTLSSSRRDSSAVKGKDHNHRE